jgi:WD40 repeat protein
MLTADSDHTINVWLLLGAQYLSELFGEDVATVSNLLTAVALSPDGRHVVTSAEDGQISAWRLTPFSSASPDVGVTINNIPEVAFSADSQELLYSFLPQSSIVSWIISQGSQGMSGQLPLSSTVFKLAVSSDGSRMAVATPRRS